MRLKEFIYFIIIFTIIYFLSLYIYDQIKNKKALNKKNEEDKNTIKLEEFNKFAKFYNVIITFQEDVLEKLSIILHSNIEINMQQICNDFNISVDELIVIILYLEYNDLIGKRAIVKNQNCTCQLTEKDESLILKYSLLFFDKFDYETMLQKGGFGSEAEIKYMDNRYLIPGVIIKDSTIYYYGDNYE